MWPWHGSGIRLSRVRNRRSVSVAGTRGSCNLAARPHGRTASSASGSGPVCIHSSLYSSQRARTQAGGQALCRARAVRIRACRSQGRARVSFRLAVRADLGNTAACASAAGENAAGGRGRKYVQISATRLHASAACVALCAPADRAGRQRVQGRGLGGRATGGFRSAGSHRQHSMPDV